MSVKALFALNQVSELVRLVRLFEAKSIPLVSIKGPLLALELYGDLGARSSNDLDFVIRPQDIFLADDILCTEGYERFLFSPAQRKSHLKHSKDFVYWHPRKQICLELHWRLFQDIGCFSVFDVPLQEIRVGDQNIKQLSPEYNLLYLCAHGSESLWQRGQWGLDIKFLLERYGNLDWHLLWKVAENYDLTRFLKEGLTRHCEARSDAAIQDPGLLRLARNDNYVWQLNAWVHRLNLRAKLKNKAKFCLSLFIPRVNDFQDLALPDYLFFAYYLARPILALRRNLVRIRAAARFRAAFAVTSTATAATGLHAAIAHATKSFLKTDQD
ncbi:MAG: nucleotidyltransferase family protein [Myxococcota bacterium]